MKKYQRVFWLGMCRISLLLTPKRSNIKVLSRADTPKYVLDNNKALIRIGDGEFRIMLRKKDQLYQKYSNALQKEMMQFLIDYKKEKACNFVLAVPNEPFINEAKWFSSINNDMILQCFGLYRFYFRNFMAKDKIYGDAFVFQRDNVSNYEKLWLNSDKVIFVHNNKKYADGFEQKYNIETYFVKVPSKNSYDVIDAVEEEIVKVVNGLDKDVNYKIVISAGPMAKALVYRLLKKDIIAYDTGHCWDEPLAMPQAKENKL